MAFSVLLSQYLSYEVTEKLTVFLKNHILLNKSLARVNKNIFYLSKWFNDIKYLLK